MSKIDINYHSLLETILEKGYLYDDPNREGVKRLEIPSYTFRYEFKDGFPAITTKKLYYKNVVTELLWFLRGDTNIKYLVDNGCNIWNKDAYNYYKKHIYPEDSLDFNDFVDFIKNHDIQTLIDCGVGNLDKVYGYYWRDYDGFDQIKDVIDKMINTPMSSEIIVTARNPNDKDIQALPCCHYGFQIVMRPLSIHERATIGRQTRDVFTEGVYKSSEELDEQGVVKYGFELHWNQRSVDTFLGILYNVASYATLALILEKITGHKALAIQGDLKKVHLYDNSLDAVKEQLSRDVDKYKAPDFDAPILDEIKFTNIDEYVNKLLPIDFTIENYESYPHIKVEMLERNK